MKHTIKALEEKIPGSKVLELSNQHLFVDEETDLAVAEAIRNAEEIPIEEVFKQE